MVDEASIVARLARVNRRLTIEHQKVKIFIGRCCRCHSTLFLFLFHWMIEFQYKQERKNDKQERKNDKQKRKQVSNYKVQIAFMLTVT